MSNNTTSSNKKESYILEIKNRFDIVIDRQTFDHNTSGIDAAFELIGDRRARTGQYFSAQIISSRDDVVYDEEFNMPATW